MVIVWYSSGILYDIALEFLYSHTKRMGLGVAVACIAWSGTKDYPGAHDYVILTNQPSCDYKLLQHRSRWLSLLLPIIHI